MESYSSHYAGIIMLNHIWTLLINNTVTSAVTGRLGDLPQTPGYKSVTLPSSLQNIRRLLFGGQPDPETLNYRTRQLLSCVLNSSLAEFATALDPRHTYDASGSDFFNLELYYPRPQQINGSTTAGMNIHGSPEADDANGIMAYSYTITDNGAADIYLTGSRNESQALPGLAANEQRRLGKSGYYFSLTAPDAAQTWLVEFVNKPKITLGQIIANVSVAGEPTLLALFGITDEQPFQTFRNIFFDVPDLPLKCAAVALALAYRTEQLRVGVSA